MIDPRVSYCGDHLEPLQKLPDACADLIKTPNLVRITLKLVLSRLIRPPFQIKLIMKISCIVITK